MTGSGPPVEWNQPAGPAHVPTAIHLPLRRPLRRARGVASSAELRRIFAPADLDGDAELITYCTIGGRAATAWFVLTYLLGRDHVRVYDGSWAEWGRQPDNPVQSDHPNHQEVPMP